jgi:hypothetical protein
LPVPRSTTGKPEIWWRLDQRQRVGQRLVGMDGDRIDHHAALEALDPAHLDRPVPRCGQIAVDDADAAGLGHGDGQPASVTVSMAADISGMSRVRVSVCPGRTDEAAGFRRTSSNVSAS